MCTWPLIIQSYIWVICIYIFFYNLESANNLPRWTAFPNTELTVLSEVNVAVISEYYYLDYCLYACQHTSVIKCSSVVYQYSYNLCKMYNATRNTPGASLKYSYRVSYLEVYQGN